MIERGLAQSARKIHRDHRPVKAYHPGPLHHRVEEEGRIRKAHEYLRRARYRGEIEQRQYPARSVAAARGENRVDFRVGEERLEFAGAHLVGAGHDRGPVERMA